ncbi:Zinc metalloproteinase nas-13 [Amphibalanus amphitrite]|uniref:Metalloendopeptidase n=1 Tax=Amphibalanus amphitrite TaxID=1232801 RepID=A0A6A4X601_AMPAM|nr:zinc metalloproteinase nas-13-like [Amphibalanus amphitrite]KAF0309811.1 Zinc metalloproteinase nas-13 [Amphibalanus amphitrite]
MTPGSCSLPALALCAALLLVGTEGHVRGIDSSDTGGQQGGTESMINAKSLMTLIRMLVTRNDVGADVEGFNTDERATIAKAVLEFERNTCIRVRPLGPTDDASQGYVRIIKGDGCYSSVGRQVSSPGQELSLGNGCLFPGIVVHEFMHAIGFWHEQSRPDRDSHVMIHYDNIKYGKDYNFKKYTTNEVQLKGTPYDVGSIMHYGPYAFARNRNQPTISALKQTSVTMGQREGLSHYDIQKINTLYGCKDVTKPPPPITKPEKCTDRNMYCKDWAAAGECGKNPLYMNIYCAKSCDKCSDKSCEDLNELCPKWAETGECAATPSYMTLYCKKSCDLCDGNGGMVCNNVNGYCEAWAEMGECDKNPDYMHGSCRKACKLC